MDSKSTIRREEAGIALPDGARFAFTILDDTDDSTLENARPVYDRLAALGFRTTKTVWPLDCPEGSRHFFAADTLVRPDYLAWVRSLVEQGFELALHGATMESSLRERTERGLARIEAEFGAVPRLYANHGFNRENVYWGPERFRTPWLRRLIAGPGRAKPRLFEGEDPASPYFWGDLCRERIEYVRGFTFSELDLLQVDPRTPYRLPDTPYVRAWFSTADAPDARSFKQRVTPAALDRLEADGGVCILSTHLGKGYAIDGRLDPAIDAVLTDLSRRRGWFVPVSRILDHLRSRQVDPERPLSSSERVRLELRFLGHSLADRIHDRLAGG